MLTYILLRDNREQGPMRLEDLLDIGLKPYDLVWVPGKSAAWRYPSEIEELKAYAPAVEEQPFDRFYKKENETTVTKQTDEPIAPQNTVVTPAVKTRFVAVTMPAGQQKTVMPKKVTEKPIAAKQEQPDYDEYKAYMPANVQQQAAEKKVVTQTVYEQLMAGESHIATQAEKIASYTERYEQTYHQRKNRWNKKALLIKYGKIAAITVIVLGIGVIFAFNVGKPETNPNVLANNSVATTLPDNNTEPVTNESNTPPVTPPEEEQPVVENNAPPPVVQQAPVSIKEKMPKEPAPVIKTSDKKPDLSKPVNDKKGLDLSRAGSAKAILDKQPMATTLDTRDAFAYETYTTANNGERSRKVRDNETAVKINDNNNNTSQAKTNSNPFYKGPEEKTVVSNNTPSENNMNSHSDVKVVANEYKVVPFGGIRNLQLTVQNRSGEALEKVVVDVEYKKRDGGVFKTKTVEFKNIAPKSSSVLKLDDTNRGVDVAYHIRKVVR